MITLGPAQFNSTFSFGHNVEKEIETEISNLRSLTDVVRDDIAKVSQQTGIPGEHLAKLHSIAQNNRCIIAFRPVHPHNTQLIQMGFPTKGLQIKGKSSVIGPIFGFIPVKQEFSGKGNKTADDLQHANQKIEECVSNGYAVKIPLELPAARLDYLKRHNMIVQVDKTHFLSTLDDGSSFKFTAEKTEAGNYLITVDGDIVQVLAPQNQPSNKPTLPFTADYDMLFLMPQWNDVLHQSKRRGSIKPAATNEHSSQLGCAHIRSKFENSSLRSSSPSPANVNFLTELEERVINDINLSLRGDVLPSLEPNNISDWNLVHHGSDEGNPSTDMLANFPSTVISPDVIGEFGAIAVISDKAELNEYLEEARNCGKGYMLVGNRAWFKEGVSTSASYLGREILQKLGDQPFSPSSSPLGSRRGSVISSDISRRGSMVSSDGSRRGSVFSSDSGKHGSSISEDDLALLKAAAERRRLLLTD